MKKYYIAVDLEGCACVAGAQGRGLADSPDLPFAKKQGTREAAAAADALFASGADEVWVWDNHGSGMNLDYDQLDPRVKIVIGSGSRTRFPGIDESFTGILFIGYHAWDSSTDAVLCHTYSSVTYQHQKVNGAFVGEMQIDAAIAGNAGVPVIFVSSDNIGVSQARASFGDIPTVETKTALAWNSCISKHPLAVCEEIRSAVKSAAETAEMRKPFRFPSPFTYEIRYARIEGAQSCTLRSVDGTPFARVDAYTRAGELAYPEDIF